MSLKQLTMGAALISRYGKGIDFRPYSITSVVLIVCWLTIRLRTSRIANGSNILLWAQFTSSAQTFFSFSNSLTYFNIYAYPERNGI